MRGMFGLVGIVVVLALVAVLVGRQLSAARAPVAVPGPAVPAPAASASDAPAGSVRAQSQQIQEQVRRQVEDALQRPRAVPGEEN